MNCTEVQKKTKVIGHRKHSNLLKINMHPQTSTEYNKERCFNNQVSFYIYNRSLVVCLILIFQNVYIILVFTVTSGFPQPTASIVVVHKMQTMHRTTYFQ